MAEDKVSAKIHASAKVHINDIEIQFSERKEKIEKEQKERAETYRKQTGELAEAEAERIRREILSEARLEARRKILKTRHEIIGSAIKTAAEKFSKSKSYPGFLAKIVARHGKGAEVLLSPEDRRRLGGYSWAKKSTTTPISGGVVLRTPKRDINFSLDAVFETLGEAITLELASVLFGEDSGTKSKNSVPEKASPSKK